MTEKREPSRWSDDLAALAAVFATTQEQLQTLPSDPFEALDRIDLLRDALKSAGVETIRSFDQVVPTLQAECVRFEAEFWGLLIQACTTAGWNIVGSTNRRLVNKALFVSHEGRTVKVEGRSAAYTPFVPSLMPALRREMENLQGSESELRSFLRLLNEVYDAVPKSGRECSLEAIYRRCVIDQQKPSFWRNPSRASFIGLSRPAFRYRLSEILRLGILTDDGRRLTFGTTTMAKDSWEIYSPGEQRTVLVGRLSFTSDGDIHGN
jgi:hypothetical protein